MYILPINCVEKIHIRIDLFKTIPPLEAGISSMNGIVQNWNWNVLWFDLGLFWQPDQTYYVIDMMCWRGYSLYDCTAEFRFFWMNSKLAETGALSAPSAHHRYKFSIVPVYECNSSGLQTVYSGPVPFERDGVLFYNRCIRLFLCANSFIQRLIFQQNIVKKLWTWFQIMYLHITVLIFSMLLGGQACTLWIGSYPIGTCLEGCPLLSVFVGHGQPGECACLSTGMNLCNHHHKRSCEITMIITSHNLKKLSKACQGLLKDTVESILMTISLRMWSINCEKLTFKKI